MPTPRLSEAQRRIGAMTGSTSRRATPTGQRSYGGRRVLAAASTFMNARPTARMRTVARRKSLGGNGG